MSKPAPKPSSFRTPKEDRGVNEKYLQDNFMPPIKELDSTVQRVVLDTDKE